jgi:hypothetical protein
MTSLQEWRCNPLRILEGYSAVSPGGFSLGINNDYSNIPHKPEYSRRWARGGIPLYKNAVMGAHGSGDRPRELRISSVGKPYNSGNRVSPAHNLGRYPIRKRPLRVKKLIAKRLSRRRTKYNRGHQACREDYQHHLFHLLISFLAFCAHSFRSMLLLPPSTSGGPLGVGQPLNLTILDTLRKETFTPTSLRTYPST